MENTTGGGEEVRDVREDEGDIHGWVVEVAMAPIIVPREEWTRVKAEGIPAEADSEKVYELRSIYAAGRPVHFWIDKHDWVFQPITKSVVDELTRAMEIGWHESMEARWAAEKKVRELERELAMLRSELDFRLMA